MNVLRDDERFLEIQSFEGGHSCARMRFIFNVVYACCSYNMRPVVPLWLSFIEGTDDEDIWLWRDGDEQALSDMGLTDDVAFEQEDWECAQIALKKRVDRTRGRGFRVMDDESRRVHQAQHRHLRFAAIAWRIVSSKALRDLDTDRGLRFKIKYNLGSLVHTWWRSCPDKLRAALRFNQMRPVYRRFLESMDNTGHKCHWGRDNSYGFDGLEEWISFLSWMDDRRDVEPVYFNRNGCSLCNERFSHPRSEMDPFLHKDEQLHVQQWQVLAALMMSELSREEYLPEEFASMMKNIYSRIYDKLQAPLVLYIEDQLWQYVAQDPPDSRYFWWINAYPAEWREALARLTPEDWQAAHAAHALLGLSDSDKVGGRVAPLHEGEVDLRTLLGTALWLLHDSPARSYVSQWDDWVESCYRLKPLWTRLPPCSCVSGISAFCRYLERTGHTCYTHHGEDLVELYASSQSLLYGEAMIKLEPLQARDHYDPVFLNCAACLAHYYATSSPSIPLTELFPGKSGHNLPPARAEPSPEELKWYSSLIRVPKPSPLDADREPWRANVGDFFECLLRCRPKFYRNSLLIVVNFLPTIWPRRLSWPNISNIRRSLTRLRDKLENLDRLNIIKAMACSGQFWAEISRCWESMNMECGELPPNLEATEAYQKDQAEISKQLESILEAHTSPFLELPDKLTLDVIDILHRYIERTKTERGRAFDMWLSGSESLPTYKNPYAWAQRLLVKLCAKVGDVPHTCYVQAVQDCAHETPEESGGSADIIRGRVDGKLVALKRWRLYSDRMSERQKANLKQLCREAIIWQYLAHQNILPFLGVECDLYPNQWCLVSLWMDNKDIVRYLRGRQPPADIHVVNYLLYEVAQGLAYLHWENLVHGDLKGMNILIDEHHHVRLADFGLSTFAETTRGANATTSSGPRGSMPFMAPELHNPTKFGFDHFQRTRSTDIYAFGCVCYEIYTGYSPWYKELGNNEGAIINAVMNGMQPSRPSPDECSGKRIDDELWKLMQRCWAPYYDRPDIRTIAHIFARKQQPMMNAVNSEILAMLGAISVDWRTGHSSALYDLLNDKGHEVIGWPDDPVLPKLEKIIVGPQGCVELKRKEAYALYKGLICEDHRGIRFVRRRESRFRTTGYR